MRAYNDRRATLLWTKIGPPLAVATGRPSDCVALLVRATSPACAALLAENLPDAITAVQPTVIRA